MIRTYFTNQVASLCILAAAALFAVPAAADELVLVEDGRSVAPILVFEGAPPMTLAAADELAAYIERISGAQPQVIEGEPSDLPERAIWVGYQPVLDSLFPDVDFEFEHPEEILIAANENHLVIAGRDAWDEDDLTVQGRNEVLEGVQQEYGTINAVYTFLQDYLDVRWLWPGETGIDVIERETIALEPFEYRYHPQLRNRWGIFRLSALGDGRGISHDWTRFQRVQLGSLEVPGGHGFTRLAGEDDTWWSRYGETRPDFFALQPNGERDGYPDARTVKMCVSNPDLWEAWFKHNVEAVLERNPNQKVFNADQNDSYHRGHCICDDCRAWDHPDGEMRMYTWEGVSQAYVAMSDRYVTFANKLGEMLKQRYPDRDYYVNIMAYGHTRPAPVEAEPADNVIISNVANFIIRPGFIDGASQLDDKLTHRQQLLDWGETGAHQVWRPNTGSPAGWQQGLPDVPVRHVADSFKFAAENGTIGIFIDTVWEHWANHGPVYYIMAQLAWDPGQDVDALLEDYYQRGFGPAADEIEAYWTLLEQTRADAVEQHGYQDIFDAVYTDELFAEAEALLDAAAEKTAEGEAIYRDRVAFVRAGYDYTRLMCESRELMQRWHDSEQSDTDAAEQIRANTERIEQILDDHPNGFLKRYIRPGHRRVSGYHLSD